MTAPFDVCPYRVENIILGKNPKRDAAFLSRRVAETLRNAQSNSGCGTSAFPPCLCGSAGEGQIEQSDGIELDLKEQIRAADGGVCRSQPVGIFRLRRFNDLQRPIYGTIRFSAAC